MTALREIVYNGWDTSPGAPPPSRPPDESAEAQQTPELQLLAWQNSAPHWPATLDSKFPEGSDEFNQIALKKKAFLQQFQPDAHAGGPNRGTPKPGRAGGVCDFSVDDGAEPFDLTRQVSLAHVADADFVEGRPGYYLAFCCELNSTMSTIQGSLQIPQSRFMCFCVSLTWPGLDFAKVRANAQQLQSVPRTMFGLATLGMTT